MSEYSNAPVEGQVSEEAKNLAAKIEQDSKQAAETFEGEQVVAPIEDDGLVAYVAAPDHANDDVLVKAGEVQYNRAEGASAPGMRSREGDVKATFVNGILVTDNEDVKAWCDAHPSFCRRQDDPATKGWITLKELASRRNNREQLIDPTEMDADATFPPGQAVMGSKDVASASSPGGKLVADAQSALESARQERRS